MSHKTKTQMKRILDNDATPTSIETKKQVKESKCFVPILSLCIAAAKALTTSTSFGRAIHIPKSPIADPSLLVQIHTVLTYRLDFEADTKRKPVLQHLTKEFPLTRCRRVIAAIHCHWGLHRMLTSHELDVVAISSSVLCAELRKWMSPREFDYLLIHTNITNVWGADAQELLLQTPRIFARYLETMPLPDSLHYEVNYLIQSATNYTIEHTELAESVVYPNLRAICYKLTTLTSERLRFNLAWIFRTVTLLPLVQAVWPLINLSECPTPAPIKSLKHTPLQTLNWVVENMPRAAKLQFLAQRSGQMWLERNDPSLRDALGIDSHDEW